MQGFALLLDRLAFSSRRNDKLAHVVAYLDETPDPDRGYAIAALSGELGLRTVTPSLLRSIVAERVDPELFALSYDYVGDLAETIALLWEPREPLRDLVLREWIVAVEKSTRADLPALIAGHLDRLDSKARLACLKLATGGLRVGVSGRLARTALSAYANRQGQRIGVDDIEEVWHGLEPPYSSLFDWLDGGERPSPGPAAFRTPMLSTPTDLEALDVLDIADFQLEWKWDGIRVQAVVDGDHRRLYSRTGEDISAAFPDVLDTLPADAVIDGELLVRRDGAVRPFADLQKRLGRKRPGRKILADYPAFLRAYDLLDIGGEDQRAHPMRLRRRALERLYAEYADRLEERIGKDSELTEDNRLDLSPLLHCDDWSALDALRREPPGVDIEGVMIKRLDSPYLGGRVKGHWFKWKREPMRIDAVLLYAQRGHGKRSGYYSDFTFGVWRGEELVPVGKAYFGFTDEELKRLDRFVRTHTLERFGPVRRVEPTLVLEVAFEGLSRSNRHKSGVAMRFPRIARIRDDKPASEADTLAALESLLTQS